MGASLAVASALPSRDFGTFAVLFSCYLMAMGASRAVSTDPLMVRHSADTESSWRDAASDATGTAVAFGLAGSVVAATAAVFLPSVRLELWVFAATLPGLLLQDAWRFAFFTAGRARSATVNDVIWACGLAIGMAPLLMADIRRLWPYVAVWGTAGAVAGVAGTAQARIVPGLRRARQWLARHRDLSPGLFGEFAVLTGVSQAVTFLVAAIVGLEEAAGVRGAMVLMGPVNVIVMGAVTLAVSEGVRLRVRDPGALGGAMRLTSLGVGAVAVLWGILLHVGLPGDVGLSVLGDSWQHSRRLILVTTALLTVNAASIGALAGLRVIERPDISFRIRAQVAPLGVVLAALGAWAFGAQGAVGGLAMAMLIACAKWWRSLRAETEE